MNKSIKLSVIFLAVSELFLASAFAQNNESQEILIETSKVTGVEESIITRKNAPNLINFITAEEIKDLPDINAGEAIRRLPGVSLETDTGEGRYVYIRGLDADFNGTTYDGLRLPPSNPSSAVFSHGGGRAVAFDAIPSGMIGSMTVTKTNIPEQDAEAIGGTIEITSKTLPLDGKGFIEGKLGGGYETQGQSGVTDLSFTAGTRFGFENPTDPKGLTGYSDKPFSIIFTSAYYEDKRNIQDVEPAPANNGIPSLFTNGIVDGWDQRFYNYNRKRHGLALDLEFQPNANNTYYIKAFDTGYTEQKSDNILTVNTANGGVSPPFSPPPNGTGPGYDQLGTFQKNLVDHSEKINNQLIMLGGKNIFDDKTLDYKVGYAKGTYHLDYDVNSEFDYDPTNGGTISPTIAYNFNGVGGTPLYTLSGLSSPNAYLIPSNYFLYKIDLSTGQTIDKEYTLKANLKTSIKVGDFDDESIKFGLNARLRNRTSGYDYWEYKVQSGTVSLSPYVTGSNINFYNGQYSNGPAIQTGVLQNIFPIVNGPNYLLNKSLLTQQNDNENVYAGYGQYEMKQGKLSIIGGLRYELTSGDYTANTLNASQTAVVGSSATYNYGNLFPSIQGKYDLGGNTFVRASFSSTIARPTFSQFTPSSSSTHNGDANIYVVQTGNPNLKPTLANSFDLSIEKYFDNGGLVSAGIFDKELSNYISNTSTISFSGAGIAPLGISPSRTVFNTSFTNLDNARVNGIELAYIQRYKNLPGVLSGLGTAFNFTLVNSKFQEFPGVYSTVPGTSKTTYNATIFYKKDKLSLNVSAYYASASLWALGDNVTTANQYYDDRFSLDIGANYQVNKNYSVYIYGKNLTNDPLKYYLGDPSNVIQREFYGPTYLAGARFTF